MITRLPNNILNRIGKYFLTASNESSKSWFFVIRDICHKYQLPHPLSLLDSPLPKDSAKELFKIKVTDFWQTKLRNDAALLPSLEHFKPQFMSLSRPHPLFQTCGNNSYELSKAVVQCRMLSGRYKTDRLVRHFNQGSDGNCSLCSENEQGDIAHILTQCTSLAELRRHLCSKLDQYPISDTSRYLITTVLNSGDTNNIVHFLR